MIVGLFLINFMEINKLFKFKWLEIKEIGNYTFTIKNQVKKNLFNSKLNHHYLQIHIKIKYK